MFTYPCLTQIYPLHAPPFYLAPTASKIPLPALKHFYPPLLIYPTLPIDVTYCYMWHLGNLPGRLLPLYKYALSWQTRDMSYMIRAYTGEQRRVDSSIWALGQLQALALSHGRDSVMAHQPTIVEHSNRTPTAASAHADMSTNRLGGMYQSGSWGWGDVGFVGEGALCGMFDWVVLMCKCVTYCLEKLDVSMQWGR